jgi:serine/threonine protein kinase/tetratricopeptide (TPR) repeat protein
MSADLDSLEIESSNGEHTGEDPYVVALQEYQALLEAGRRPDRTSFMCRFPAEAASLADAMDGLDFLYQAVGSSRGSGGAIAPDGRPVPSQLGDFRIVREIGRGGMGVVYEAEQISLGRRVALKVLPFAAAIDERQLQRFKTEAQAAAHLHHTNIVPVFAVGADRGVHYYAMQFIEGRTLAHVIRELRKESKPPSTPGLLDKDAEVPSGTTINQPVEAPAEVGKGSTAEQAALTTRPRTGGSSEPLRLGPGYYKALARLAIQAAEALEYAHSMGIVHRDIKPANMLVDARGNLWVADFGLAQFHGGDQTATGDVLGTLRYMSPEQAGGRRGTVDHRTDIYSLGISLYELTTLCPAFSARDRAELLRQILHDEPPRPRSRRRGIPIELETVILKAIAKRPAERYATAQELADDLRRFVEDKPVLARRPTPFQIAGKWVRRHTGIVATMVAAAFVVAIVFAVAAGTLFVANKQLRDLQQQTDQARKAAEKNATMARAQTDRAEKSTKRALDLLQNVAKDLADKRLAQDPAWGQQSERVLNAMLDTCAVVASGEGGNLSLRLQAIEDGLYVARAFADLGRGDKAKKASAQVIEWQNSLIKEFPNQWPCHFQLAKSHRLFGLLLRQLGENKAAVEQFQLALGAWNDPDPMTPCPYEASESHDNLGDLAAHAGDRSGAERHYKAAFELRTKGLRELEDANQKDNHRFVCSLAEDHVRLGETRLDAGDRPGADKQFHLALDILGRLVSEHPQVSYYALLQAQCFRELGDIWELSDPGVAVAQYQKALAVLPPLAEKYPGLPSFRQLLADVHIGLGKLAPAVGKPDEAADHFNVALDLLTKLGADLPDGSPGPGLPGTNENSLAWFLVNCPDVSFRDPKRALELARKSVNRAPQQADCWNTLGGAYFRVGDAAQAVGALQRAVDLRQGGDAMDWLLMAASRWSLGQATAARDARSKAVAWLEKNPRGRTEEVARLQKEVEEIMSKPPKPQVRQTQTASADRGA